MEESVNIVEYIIQMSVVFGIITANSLGGSLASMWIMLNLMQLWFLVGLLHINWPASTTYTIAILETVNFENAFTTMISEWAFPEEFFEEETFTERFETQFDNPYFVAGLADVIPFFIFNIITFSATAFLAWLFSLRNNFSWLCGWQ